ncbi:hypothetical protein CU633_11025 [Bacillus sp. V3-13]|uniref:PH domain-containing protein n=1 Tax=Bacillus sp. V3-13 TaxID=2053728 RepID=UPI000C774B96|nr:PH domain-containing protein [Bacillus sp. V3-13]PLR77299.1 hypothetical protein CU633_11025 [Bacillus sp. V3-13]
MFEAKRLHPISTLHNFSRNLKELIVPFIIFVFLGGNGTNADLVFWLISIGSVLLVLAGGVLSWLRFTYRVEDGELRIEHGIIIRKKRYIPFERIQSLDYSEGIFHRPFGLVKVKVETAGGMGLNEPEAVLTAITKAEADAIQQILMSAKNNRRTTVDKLNETEEELIYKITPSELLLLASTSGGVGVVISAVIAFFFQFDEIIPYRRLFAGFERFIQSGIVFVSTLIFIGFIIAWVLAVIGTMFKYADFTVKRINDDLVISRGLLEKRQTTIPLKRIQAVRIRENLIRQSLGYASVSLESGGGSFEKGDESQVLLLPVIRKNKVAGLLQNVLNDYHLEAIFVPAPQRAKARYVTRGLLIAFPFAVVPAFFFHPWGYLSLLLFFPAAIWSLLMYKDAGWNLENQQLALRYRGLVKNTVYMKKTRIQSLSNQESYFQKKKDLATVEAFVISGIGAGGGKVVDIEKHDAIQIYKWYSGTD